MSRANHANRGFLNFLLFLESHEFKNLEIFPPFLVIGATKLVRDFGYHSNCNFHMKVFQIKL